MFLISLMLAAAIQGAGSGPRVVAFTPKERTVIRNALPGLRKRLDSKLLDYTSTRFRDVQILFLETNDGSQLVAACGFLNSKNRSGAYVGWDRFLVTQLSDPDLKADEPAGITLISDLCDSNKSRTDGADHSADLTFHP